mgnify:CR=1 FL=1
MEMNLEKTNKKASDMSTVEAEIRELRDELRQIVSLSRELVTTITEGNTPAVAVSCGIDTKEENTRFGRMRCTLREECNQTLSKEIRENIIKVIDIIRV